MVDWYARQDIPVASLAALAPAFRYVRVPRARAADAAALDASILPTMAAAEATLQELDAVGTKRFDSELSGDREVQRTMLELLNQLFYLPRISFVL